MAFTFKIIFTFVFLSFSCEVFSCEKILLRAENFELTYSEDRNANAFNLFRGKSPLEIANILYGKSKTSTYLKRLRNLDPNLEDLVSDIGIIARLDIFENFFRSQKTDYRDVVHLREKFKVFLGKTTVYRAIRLESDSEARALISTGVLSLMFRVKDEEAKQKQIRQVLKLGTIKEIQSNLVRKTSSESSRFFASAISVSKYPNIAAAIAGSFGKGDHIYIYEAEVDEFDVIRLGGEYRWPLSIRIAQWLSLNTLVVKSRAVVDGYPYDDRVEAFMQFGIFPSEIKNIYKAANVYRYGAGLEVPDIKDFEGPEQFLAAAEKLSF